MKTVKIEFKIYISIDVTICNVFHVENIIQNFAALRECSMKCEHQVEICFCVRVIYHFDVDKYLGVCSFALECAL
jgi:hypothetical protein